MYNTNGKRQAWLNKTTVSYCILQVFLLLCFSDSALGVEHSRRADFGPVRMTISEIVDIVNESYSYISKVNKENLPTTNRFFKIRATATFESERRSAALDLPISKDDLRKIPERVTTVNINLSSDDGDISRWTLGFSDSSRYIQVSGKNIDQVSGLLNVIKEKIETHEVIVGGDPWRSRLKAFFVIIFVFAWFVWVISNGAPNVTFLNNTITIPKRFLLELAVLFIVPIAVIYFTPWADLLPGCLITPDNLSFLDRYSSLFTFLGFIVPLLISGSKFTWTRITVGRSKLNQNYINLPITETIPITEGLVMWLDASDISTLFQKFEGKEPVTAGKQLVAFWQDKSGNDNHFSQAKQEACPCLVKIGIGSKPSVMFNVDQSFFMTRDFPAPVTVIYVARQMGGSNHRVLSAMMNNWLLGYWSGAKNQAYYEGWVSTKGQPPITDNLPHVFSGIVRGPGQNSEVWADRLLVAENKNGVAGPYGLAINTGRYWQEVSDCQVAEIIVYKRGISDVERQNVEAYLMKKWEITT